MAKRKKAARSRQGSIAAGHIPASFDDLRPAEYNPREISESAAVGLRASITEFGDISGIVWNSRSGNLVCGHQRVAQLQAAGGKFHKRQGVAYIVCGDDRFDVRVVDWDEATERTANISANNPHIAGEFTIDVAGLLDDIQQIDPMQFERLNLDDLALDFPVEEPEVEEDEVPEPPKKARTKTGDLITLGGHRLLCGDSTNEKDVKRLMGKEIAVLMNTDPPYGIDYSKLKDGIPDSGFTHHQEHWGDIENDTLTDGAELQAFLEAAIRLAVPHLSETAAYYLWHPMLTQGTFFAAAAAADILIHRQIIWVKPGFVLTRSGMYHWRHELCFYGWRRGHKPPWYGNKSQTSVWELGRDIDSGQHPTQKPIELFAIPMRNHTRQGEAVYDPFSGSGSQVIAAEQLGRVCFGMEIDPRYCDVIVERWETLTGGKARRPRKKVSSKK